MSAPDETELSLVWDMHQFWALPTGPAAAAPAGLRGTQRPVTAGASPRARRGGGAAARYHLIS